MTAATATAAGKRYKAQRFDVNATVMPNGDLDVVERITFEFQEGVFREVWRDIPAAWNDAVDVISGSVDGVAMPLGDGPGSLKVTGTHRRRITWQFAPTGPSTRSFELQYVLRGVVYPEGTRALVRWQALPTEHAYRIDASQVTIDLPDAAIDPPQVETHRLGEWTVTTAGRIVNADATDIPSNGWFAVTVHMPGGAISAAPPQWYQRQRDARAAAPRWATAAGVAFIAGVFVVFLLRSPYDAPHFEESGTTEPERPEEIAPAMAGALMYKGRVPAQLAVATLMDLGDRGVITVTERPRTFGVRQYELEQIPGTYDLAAHEETALALAFGGRSAPVMLARARGRLVRGLRRFSAAVEVDLAAKGLLDPSRRAVRNRLTTMAIVLMLGSALATIPAAFFLQQYNAYPLLVPAAVGLAGLIALIAGATTTSLTDDGLARGARWRAFRRRLKEVAAARGEAAVPIPVTRWISYAIALGLGYQWSRYLKHHPEAAPAWFHAMDHDGAAFAAFVASGSASGAGGGAGAGAAGGGGSGAA